MYRRGEPELASILMVLYKQWTRLLEWCGCRVEGDTARFWKQLTLIHRPRTDTICNTLIKALKHVITYVINIT